MSGRLRAVSGGAVCVAALVLVPSAADATVHATYGLSDTWGAYVLDVEGDANPQDIHLRCASGDVTINSSTFFLSSAGHNLHCNEPERIFVGGDAGDDDIDLTGVSEATGYTSIFSFQETPTEAVDAIGGAGEDTIEGGPFGERFNASNDFNEPGPDTVHAGPGNDEVWGTRQDDNLFADAGDDVVYPQGGADTAHGGPGHDAFDDVTFLKDADHFLGEGGPDQIFGGGGADTLDGGGGKDYIDGQGGADLVLGRAGNDGIFGSAGNDNLFGHTGNDFIRGGPGHDQLHPGPGKDDVRQ
jgi:Ca2+-binding RTX toxin-like protein